MKLFFSVLLALIVSVQSFSQPADSITPAWLPERYFNKVEEKISSIDDKIIRQTEKYLKKLQKQEDKIKRRLVRIDYFWLTNA